MAAGLLVLRSVLSVFINQRSAAGAQPAFGGHLPPPKMSKHRIVILAFAETFKDLR